MLILTLFAAASACSKDSEAGDVGTAPNTRTFQMLPPQISPLDASGNSQPVADKEEMGRFMRRQEALIVSEQVINSVLTIDAVQKTNWFKENFSNAGAALRKGLKVTPDADAELLHITMTCDSPTDAVVIVSAVASEYMETLKNDQEITVRGRQDTVSKAVAMMQAQVDQAEQEMRGYRITNKVEAILGADPTPELQALEREAVQAEMNLAGAQANVDQMREKTASGTLELTPEYEASVQNDATLRSIASMMVQLKVDRDVLIMSKGPENAAVKDLDARLDALERQRKETHAELESGALVAMQQNAAASVQTAQARFDFLSRMKQTRETEVRDLDRKLVVYRQMEQQLAEKTRTLNELEAKQRMMNLAKDVDLSRVRQFGI
jgi:uncharacterized protein involved in exopolysaccharide biosynthesis